MFVAMSRTAADLVREIASLGIDYDKAHAEDMAKLAASNDFLANFKEADFKHAVKGDEPLL